MTRPTHDFTIAEARARAFQHEHDHGGPIPSPLDPGGMGWTGDGPVDVYGANPSFDKMLDAQRTINAFRLRQLPPFESTVDFQRPASCPPLVLTGPSAEYREDDGPVNWIGLLVGLVLVVAIGLVVAAALTGQVP